MEALFWHKSPESEIRHFDLLTLPRFLTNHLAILTHEVLWQTLLHGHVHIFVGLGFGSQRSDCCRKRNGCSFWVTLGSQRKTTGEFDLGPSYKIVGSGWKNKPEQSKPLVFETGSHVAWTGLKHAMKPKLVLSYSPSSFLQCPSSGSRTSMPNGSDWCFKTQNSVKVKKEIWT